MGFHHKKENKNALRKCCRGRECIHFIPVRYLVFQKLFLHSILAPSEEQEKSRQHSPDTYFTQTNITLSQAFTSAVSKGIRSGTSRHHATEVRFIVPRIEGGGERARGRGFGWWCLCWRCSESRRIFFECEKCWRGGRGPLRNIRLDGNEGAGRGQKQTRDKCWRYRAFFAPDCCHAGVRWFALLVACEMNRYRKGYHSATTNNCSNATVCLHVDF